MRGSFLPRVLAGGLALALAAPVPLAFGAGASIGTARGIRSAELSLDGGQRWLALGARSLPVLDGARVRSAAGGALLDLADGSRVNLLPFSSARIAERGGAIAVALDYGRLTFRLPERTRVIIETKAARLEPVGREVRIGEVVAAETTGLRMTRGSLRVVGLAGGEPVRVASLEPVFVPEPPARPEMVFTADRPEKAPAGARGVFSAKGESLGYLRPDGQLVVHPGFTADLTQPFAPRVVQVATASIPQQARADAMPLFDVHGTYVGYVSGPVFYAQAQQLPPGSRSGQGLEAGTPALVAIGTTAAMFGGGFALSESTKDDDQPATPITP